MMIGIKQELDEMEAVAKSKNLLVCQRREIEKELLQATSALQSQELKTHRDLEKLKVEKGASDPHRQIRQDLLAKLDNYHQRLHYFKDKLKQIDHLLDTLEGDLGKCSPPVSIYPLPLPVCVPLPEFSSTSQMR